MVRHLVDAKRPGWIRSYDSSAPVGHEDSRVGHERGQEFEVSNPSEDHHRDGVDGVQSRAGECSLSGSRDVRLSVCRQRNRAESCASLSERLVPGLVVIRNYPNWVEFVLEIFVQSSLMCQNP